MRLWPKLSIHSAILVTSLCAVGLPAALMLAIEPWLNQQSNQPLVDAQRDAQLRMLAAALAPALGDKDVHALQSLALQQLSDPSVSAVEVHPSDPAIPVLRQGRQVKDAVRQTVLRQGDQVIGLLSVDFDDSPQRRVAASRREDALILLAVQAGVLLVLLLPLLGLRLRAPIARLRRQASAMAWRNHLPPQPWTQQDELGDLGRHLTEVALRVEASLDQAAQQRSQLEALALRDSLTGLPNRSLFAELLRRELRRTQRDGGRLALLHLDLDHFRTVSDSVGHEVGDELLRAVATRLAGVLRESDAVGRIGGDKFAIVLHASGSWDETAAAAQRVLKVVELPIEAAGCALQLTASAGLALYPDDAPDAETLTHHAELALHQAKTQGRGRCCFFHADLNHRMTVNRALAQQLVQAIQNDELELFFQPEVDARDARLLGLEALLRWRHPHRGLLAPEAFLDVAEECGLIGDIGAWVVDAACRQIAAWKQQGLTPPRVALNVSAQEFRQSRVIDSFAQAMHRHEVAACELEIEINETVLLADTPTTRDVLQRLRGLGLDLVIDDFGAGGSSLAWLKRLRPAKLKIDRSIVHGIHEDAEDRALACAVVQLGRAFGMPVVAEGVELAAQRQVLVEEGCMRLQGYLVSLPIAADELTQTFLTPAGNSPAPALVLPFLADTSTSAGAAASAAEPEDAMVSSLGSAQPI